MLDTRRISTSRMEMRLAEEDRLKEALSNGE